jgi:hypothetical protein
MKTSTRNEPDDRFGDRRNDRDTRPASQPPVNKAKVKTAVRCRLCRETIVLESNFRPTPATCPHCGLEFVFDPQQAPLPVAGMRLRQSAVLEAQRGSGTARHRTLHYKRHPAHVHPAAPYQGPRTHYLAWAGGLALSLAAAFAFFGGWFQKLLAR